jgi:hypothetical protein
MSGLFGKAFEFFEEYGYLRYVERMTFTPEQRDEMWKVKLEQSETDLAAIRPDLPEYDVFIHLPDAAMGAYYLERFDEARQMAERALEMAPRFRQDWSYGNAIHAAHSVLGLLALRNGDEATAIAELHRAGETPGSPQLDSFGPDMQLAKDLLRRGHVEAVLAHFEQCRKFWELGGASLKIWERMIRTGRTPNFFHHSRW